MDGILNSICDFLLLQGWQIAVVFAVVAIACRLLRHASAHWRYLLWMIVLVKCVVPPQVTVPLAVLPTATRTPATESAAPIARAEPPALPRIMTPPVETMADTQKNSPLAPIAAAAENSIAISPGAASKDRGPHREDTLAKTLPQRTAIGWAIGVALLLTLSAVRAIRIQRQIRRTRRVATAELAQEANSLARNLGLHKPPRIWLIDDMAQPFVWGMVQGSIYLPGNFGKNATAEHRRGILMHELAHVARYDAAVNLLQVLVQAAFFFHPLVWWANKRIRQEREKCCDEVAIAHLGTAPRQYGQAIVESLVREYESTQPISSLAVAGPVRNIEERIMTILTPNRQFHRKASWLAIGSALLLGTVLAPCTFVLTARAQDGGKQAAASNPATPASQPIEPSAFMDTVMGLDAYPSASPDALAERMRADLLSDKWHSQDGDFASLTLRNPDPQREARIPFHQKLALTPEQKQLLFDSPMSYISIAGTDEDTLTVDATIFVRSRTTAAAARAYAEQIQVDLAPTEEYVRLGEHILKFKPQDIQEAGVLYDVKVPRRLSLDVRVRNGRTYVHDTAGELTYWGGGMLVVRNVTGPIFIGQASMTLLTDLPGPQPIRIHHQDGPLAIINVAAPMEHASLSGATYLDFRKCTPARLDLEVSRTNIANIVLGRGTLGQLTIAGNKGLVVHQPDGSVVQAAALRQPFGSDDRPLNITTGSTVMNVWTQQPLNINEPAPQTQPGTTAALQQAGRANQFREELARLQTEVDDAQRGLAAKQNEIAQYMITDAAIPGILEQTTAITDNLMRLTRMRTEAKARAEALRSPYEAYQKAGSDKIPVTPETLKTVESDPLVLELEKRRLRLEEDRHLLEGAAATQPQAQEIDKRIEVVANQLRDLRFKKINDYKRMAADQLRLDLVAAIDQLNQVDQQYREAEAAQSDLDHKRAHLNNLMEDKARLRKRLDQVTQDLQDLQRVANRGGTSR